MSSNRVDHRHWMRTAYCFIVPVLLAGSIVAMAFFLMNRTYPVALLFLLPVLECARCFRWVLFWLSSPEERSVLKPERDPLVARLAELIKRVRQR